MKNKFSPLILLASLSAGGISVIPFAFLNYTVPHETGLIKITDISHSDFTLLESLFFRFLDLTMVTFIVIHLVLSVFFFIKLYQWLQKDDYRELIENPLSNSSILAPFISLIMTMNVVIGPVRYFLPAFAENLQSVMLPALVAWSVIWVFLMKMEIKLLRISFEKNFDVNKIHFGWLLHPFALGMLTVTGTGIAALSQHATIAHVSAFMSMTSGSMGLFLLLVKMIALFKSHFAAPSLPERQFFPSFLIVIPNITLYAISAFRLGHYLEHHHNAEMGAYFLLVMTFAFAFETWYLAFGFSLLKNYFVNYFSKEYYVSQWGLVCPIVAYAVLGSFVHKVFVPNLPLYILIILTLLASMTLFLILLKKHLQCSAKASSAKITCN